MGNDFDNLTPLRGVIDEYPIVVAVAKDLTIEDLCRLDFGRDQRVRAAKNDLGNEIHKNRSLRNAVGGVGVCET